MKGKRIQQQHTKNEAIEQAQSSKLMTHFAANNGAV